MKIKKFIGALILSLALFGVDIPLGIAQVENFFVNEDDDYDSSFRGPLTFCVRKDSAAAFASADGKTQPVICDDEGKLYTTSAGGSGGAVTNVGVFAVQEDGAALTAQQAIQTAVELIDNLVHNIDDAVGATDAVVGLGCKHEGDTVHLTTADGDYDIVRCSNFGAMQTEPEQHHVFDALDVVGSWLILDDATANFTTTKKHVLGTDALIFDKVNGSGTFAAVIDQTITAVDLGKPSPHDLLQTVIYIPDLTDVAYVLVRVGTDDTNYNEWRIPDSALTAATFETLIFNIGDAAHAGITGNGWNPSVITYIALGVQFDGEDDALVGMIFDEFSFHTNQHTSAELNAEVSSTVSSAKVDLQKINGSVTDKNSGNKSNGSQRIVVATDDVNLSAIKTAVELNATATNQLADGHNVTVDNANGGSAVHIQDGGNTITVDGTVTTNDAAGFLHGNSPTTLVDTFVLFDGSGETQIATTNLGASKAITITGSGTITKICVIVSLGTPFAEDMSIIFFDTDPSITIEDASLTLAQAQNAQVIISLSGSDFRDNFATVKLNCQATEERFSAITHVVFASEGATTYDDEDIEIRLWYRRDS